ncbi:MAG: diadenylate cyclase [Phycisphaerales bacterium]
MGSAERLQDLLSRLGSYNWWEVAIEFLAIWLVVYAALRFVQGTRAARALKGLLFVLIVGTLTVRFFGDDLFARIAYLYDRVLAVIAIALVVIFQPELRRALIRLGETGIMRGVYQGADKVAAELAPACVFLSKARFGAIIVIERRVGLKSMIDGGTVLNASLTAALIQTIFHPGSALHDLAVVIRGDKVHSAGVQLPMANAAEIDDQSFGSRHRAAIGVTKETDALVIVVSEETGAIRIAERGVLSSPIEMSNLEALIREHLGHKSAPEPAEKEESGVKEDTPSGFADDSRIESGVEPEPEESLMRKPIEPEATTKDKDDGQTPKEDAR